jgi:hypothetical protein
VKKIDYYAVQNPWRMPKWIGATLGGIFGVIVVGSMITIVQLTKSNAPAPVAAVAAAPVAQAPAAAPVAAATTVKATAPVASADEAAPVNKHRSSKRHASSSHGKKGKLLASAKRAPAASTMGSAQRQTILAKHDSKDKRLEKDALDKLLGL